jgi:hypothetical protein
VSLPDDIHRSTELLRKALVGLLLAAPTLAQNASGDVSTNCADRQGLVALIRQGTMFLHRSPRQTSATRSLLTSLAATALTAGNVVLIRRDAGDSGASVSTPVSEGAEFNPAELAGALTNKLTDAHFTEFVVLPGQTDSAAVDALLLRRGCNTAYVVSLEYRLEQLGKYAHLYFSGRLLHLAPQNVPSQTNVAKFEYYSGPVTLELDRHELSEVTAFGKWLSSNQLTLHGMLTEGVSETVAMTAEALTKAENRADGEPVGAHLSTIACQGCLASDRLVRQSAKRVWLQPADEPDFWRSLPMRQ